MKLDSQTLLEFFHEHVQKAQQHQKISLLEVTQFYVVNLLVEALLTQHVFISLDTEQIEEPLALMFGRANATTDQHQKIQLLKKVGDRSLYVSGFFSESFQKKLVNMNYYISMGGMAYFLISSLLENQAHTKLFPEVFTELSGKFRKLVDLLSEISELSGVTNNHDLVRMYERWLQTKSPRLYKQLIANGMFAQDTPERTH